MQRLARSAQLPPWWLRFLVLGLLAGAFALRLHELTRQPIWWDEARNLDVALRPMAAIASAPELDIQPPLYYWLLHLWLGLTGLQSGAAPAQLAFFSRFFSVAAGLLSTALLYPLGRMAFNQAAATCAVAIAALSPFWLAESQETRMYTLGFALLTSAALALLQLTRSPKTPPRSAFYVLRSTFPFVVCAALALWTHYNALFSLLAWFVWWGGWVLLQPDRWRNLRTPLLCGFAIGLLLTPLIPIALRQIPTYANPNLTIPTVSDYLTQNWRAYLGGYAFDPALLAGNGLAWLWAVLALTLVGALCYLVPGKFPSSSQPASRLAPATFLAVWAIGGLALYYVAVLDRGAFNVRYSSFMTPALYVIVGGALAAWGRWWRPLVLGALAVVVAGLIPAIRADLYDPRFAREDIAGVTAWLRTVAGPEDLILVDQKYPFGFYYDRYTIDPATTPAGPEPAPARYLFVDINTLDQQLNQWAAQARQVFWVQWFESDTDPRHAVPFLLNQAGQPVGSQSFQGYVVDWWALEPPNHFTLAEEFTPFTFRFPPAAETVAISLPTTPLTPGQGIPVVIRWQRLPGEITRPYKARVALYDANDARLAQSDERLLNDRHLAPSEWSLTDQPLNVYLLPTPADLAEGEYQLRLLVYDAETLEPIPLVDQAGAPAGLEATLGTVEVRDE
jgi:mannosyltransferase